MSANAATAKRLPWQVAGEMLKWMTDGKLVKSLIPIAVGEDSIAFPRRSVKAAVFKIFCKRANCDRQMISGG